MKVQELVDKLGLKVLAGKNGLDREIDGCYISDLLSDVMGMSLLMLKSMALIAK